MRRRLRNGASLLLLFALSAGGCDRVVAWMDGDQTATEALAGPPAAKKSAGAAEHMVKLVPPRAVSLASAKTTGAAPRDGEPLDLALSWLRTRAAVGESRDLFARVTPRTLTLAHPNAKSAALVPIAAKHIRQKLAGKVARIDYVGHRAAVTLDGPEKRKVLWFFQRQGRWLWDIAAPESAMVTNPGPRHAMNVAVTLEAATRSIHGTGPLVVKIDTTAGAIRCKLDTGRSPRSVAHFVGLARGLRATLDHSVTPPVWTRIPAFDGTTLKTEHASLAVVGGRSAEQPIGFYIPDELDAGLRHDRAGMLGLLNQGPGTTAGGFYITRRAAPELDDRYNLIGDCRDSDVVTKTSASPKAVRVVSVRVQRGF